ncbi:MAG: c-type cytochrome [Panacagrimonas sp.]
MTGRNAAAVCTGCHGARGISANEEWPNIAGQQARYLAKQLTDYREGRRENLIMSQVAKRLGDSEIEALAAYFSALD